MSRNVSQEEDEPSTGRSPRYRVDFLNPDGTIFRTAMLDACDDNEASKLARRLMDGQALDLWEGTRFIEFFPRIDPLAGITLHIRADESRSG